MHLCISRSGDTPISPATLEGFLSHVERLERDALTREKRGTSVTLSTVHRAKGLEWPHVFVIRCNEGTMPHLPPTMSEEEGDGCRVCGNPTIPLQMVMDALTDPKEAVASGAATSITDAAKEAFRCPTFCDTSLLFFFFLLLILFYLISIFLLFFIHSLFLKKKKINKKKN